MATKTITVTEDAYERLEACKQDGESFSDVIRRITSGANLSDYRGVLDDETGDRLAAVVEERRTENRERRNERRENIRSSL